VTDEVAAVVWLAKGGDAMKSRWVLIVERPDRQHGAMRGALQAKGDDSAAIKALEIASSSRYAPRTSTRS